MVELVITENVVIIDFPLADPAVLCILLLALGTAGMLLLHEECVP